MKARYLYGLGVLCSALILAILATPILGQVRGRVDPIDPCCSIKTIDARTRTVVVTEKATGCALEFGVNSADDLKAFSVGASISLEISKLHPAPPPPSSTGQAASGTGGTTSCGSNVGRYASTKTCFAVVSGKTVSVPCTK